MTIHLLRMAAGCEDLAELAGYLKREIRTEKGIGPYTAIHTRNKPKRMTELLDGGSVYNIMRSMIQCRRRVLDVREVKGRDGASWCQILLEPKLIRVMPTPQRPFQGWRYLDPKKAPVDLGVYMDDSDAPPAEMAEELRELGLL